MTKEETAIIEGLNSTLNSYMAVMALLVRHAKAKRLLKIIDGDQPLDTLPYIIEQVTQAFQVKV